MEHYFIYLTILLPIFGAAVTYIVKHSGVQKAVIAITQGAAIVMLVMLGRILLTGEIRTDSEEVHLAVDWAVRLLNLGFCIAFIIMGIQLKKMSITLIALFQLVLLLLKETGMFGQLGTHNIFEVSWIHIVVLLIGMLFMAVGMFVMAEKNAKAVPMLFLMTSAFCGILFTDNVIWLFAGFQMMIFAGFLVWKKEARNKQETLLAVRNFRVKLCGTGVLAFAAMTLMLGIEDVSLTAIADAEQTQTLALTVGMFVLVMFMNAGLFPLLSLDASSGDSNRGDASSGELSSGDASSGESSENADEEKSAAEDESYTLRHTPRNTPRYKSGKSRKQSEQEREMSRVILRMLILVISSMASLFVLFRVTDFFNHPIQSRAAAAAGIVLFCGCSFLSVVIGGMKKSGYYSLAATIAALFCVAILAKGQLHWNGLILVAYLVMKAFLFYFMRSDKKQSTRRLQTSIAMKGIVGVILCVFVNIFLIKLFAASPFFYIFVIPGCMFDMLHMINFAASAFEGKTPNEKHSVTENKESPATFIGLDIFAKRDNENIYLHAINISAFAFIAIMLGIFI